MNKKKHLHIWKSYKRKKSGISRFDWLYSAPVNYPIYCNTRCSNNKKEKKKDRSKIVSSTRSPTCPNRTIIELSLSSLLWAWNPNARGSKFCASKRDLSEWRCKPATLSARASWSALVPRWHGHECLPAHVQAHVHAYFRTDCLQRDNKPTRVRTRDERMDAADPLQLLE